MSSKIYNGPEYAAQPMPWRRSASLPAHGRAPLDDSGRKAAEAQMQAAYQQGIAAGQAAAAQAAQARLDPALGALADIVNELAGCRRILRAQAEGATVALAMAIARRVLHRELNIDPTAILGLVKAAFDRCDASETHRLRVSPSDARLIQENRSRLEFPQALEVMPDPALVSGSAIFETSRGELDASVDTQLSEIERGLTDVLRRRSS